jgi:hypothetical protein
MEVEARLQTAREYVASGLSLVPIAAKSKWPPIKWEMYQERKPTDAELKTWIRNYPGLGVVGGKVSGSEGVALEILDLESIAPLDTFRQFVEEAAPGLLDELPRVKTPTGGRHIYYRCDCILRHVDESAHTRMKEIEAQERDTLKWFLEGWGDLNSGKVEQLLT